MSGSCVARDQCQGRRADGVDVWTEQPLCPWCLAAADHDVAALVLDYVDLEQIIPATTRHGEPISGTPEPSIPISVGVEALQRAIWHLTTTWEAVVRAEVGLSEPVVIGVRDGWAVQRAVVIIRPRLDLIATLEAVDGAAGILAMTALHRRAKGVLGRYQLVHALPGTCAGCKQETLRRNDGSETVHCTACQHTLTWTDYLAETGLV